MNRITIPDTELSLCPIGMGAIGAGLKWDGKEADTMFATYLELGGNLVDTARIYQDWVPGEIGRSERAVGDWIKRSGKRNEIILMTKGGHPKFTGPQDDLHLSRMSDADMRYDLELSLRALQTDVIDIYFYHRDNERQSIEEEIETMENFVREGKIRYYACSNWSADRMRQADAYCREKGYRGFVADQTLLNVGMVHMKPMSDDTLTSLKDDILAYHKEQSHNLAMAYSSTAGGFFQRLIEKGEAPESNYATPGNLAVAEKIKALAAQYETGVTQIVLAYVLNREFPCVALIGPGKPERITESMKTLEIAWKREDFQNLTTIEDA